MDTHPAGAGRPPAPDPAELRLLEAQLEHVRRAPSDPTDRALERIRIHLLLALALLILGGSGLVPAAVLAVPFIVPFAFLEAGYRFFRSVSARRHAELLEHAINRCIGRDVLVGTGLDPAHPHLPTAPRTALLPLGMPLALTLGYLGGAALLWIVGLAGTTWYAGEIGDTYVWQGLALATLAVPLQLAWTAAIAGHLVVAFLTRRDERRLIAELDRSYGPPARPAA